MDTPLLWHIPLSHFSEKVRWTLDYKRIPHIRRSLLPGLHTFKAERLTGDTSTTPVITVDGRSIGDSTRIIAFDRGALAAAAVISAECEAAAGSALLVHDHLVHDRARGLDRASQ